MSATQGKDAAADSTGTSVLGGLVTREMVVMVCEGHGSGTAYQPIVDTARGSIVGYEALARFPGYEQRNPEVWFATARELGLSAAARCGALVSGDQKFLLATAWRGAYIREGCFGDEARS